MSKCIAFTLERRFPDDDDTYYFVSAADNEMWINDRSAALRFASIEAVHAKIAELLDNDPTNAGQFTAQIMLWEIEG